MITKISEEVVCGCGGVSRAGGSNDVGIKTLLDFVFIEPDAVQFQFNHSEAY